MKSRVKNWLKRDSEQILGEVGIKRGQIVLDFGCGSGIYTIPAARIVGETGRVYGLDKNWRKLAELGQKVKKIGLMNVEKIRTSGELEIPLGEKSVDVVLLYDVFHHHHFSRAEREQLLSEVSRVLKPWGVLSVYPTHMDPKRIEKEVTEGGFLLEERFPRRFLVHDSNLEEGELLNFRKGE